MPASGGEASHIEVRLYFTEGSGADFFTQLTELDAAQHHGRVAGPLPRGGTVQVSNRLSDASLPPTLSG